jgi:hypothetical protein
MHAPDFVPRDLARRVKAQRHNLAELAACLRDGCSPGTVADTLLLIADELGSACWEAESLLAIGAGDPIPPLPADAATFAMDATPCVQ